MASRDEQNARYRQGLCCDCGEKPYSAGRPRCAECHREHVTPFEPGMQQRDKGVA